MEFLAILIIAIGLSMDSIAVSVAVSPCFSRIKKVKEEVKFSLILSVFHVGFIFLGWFFGYYIEKYFNTFSHWIAFAILFVIGIKMIKDGLKKDKRVEGFNVNNIYVLLGLGVATSIDALFVGISMSLADFNFSASIVIIGIVTFILSFTSIKFGKKIKSLFRFSVELLGGVVLIIIGAKILLDSLLF